MFTVIGLAYMSAAASAQSKPAFANEAQGEWYVLTAHSGNRNLALATPAMHGSKVTITNHRLTWTNPGDGKTPWVSADCTSAPPAADKKMKQDPNELISVVRGSLCPKQGVTVAARWKLTDNDVLLVLVQVAEFTGNRNGTYSGSAPADVIFALHRRPLPAMLKPDPEVDRKRFVGKWAVVAEFDDANAARTQPGGTVNFTIDRLEKRQGKGKPGQGSGEYQVVAPTDKWGRIDLLCPKIPTNPKAEGAGRLPSLYAFHGDNLLFICWPEGGWKGEAFEKASLRMPPEHFQSDGSRNLWILERRK